MDLFPTITQGALTDRPGELSVPCGPETTTYPVTFTNVAPGFVTGDARHLDRLLHQPGGADRRGLRDRQPVVKLHVVLTAAKPAGTRRGRPAPAGPDALDGCGGTCPRYARCHAGPVRLWR